MEIQEVWKAFIKVGSGNVCSLSYQFYYTYETDQIVSFIKEKKYFDLTLKLMREIRKHHFWRGGVSFRVTLWTSIVIPEKES